MAPGPAPKLRSNTPHMAPVSHVEEFLARGATSSAAAAPAVSDAAGSAAAGVSPAVPFLLLAACFFPLALLHRIVAWWLAAAYASESAFFSVSETSPPSDARMARVESRACLALCSAAIATFSLELMASSR